jgi:hypothetical protein
VGDTEEDLGVRRALVQTTGATGRLRARQGRVIPAGHKITSVLRRVPQLEAFRYLPSPALEGDVCAFQLPPEVPPIVVEAVSGRAMTVASGDVFLGTPGFRESTRWVVGGVPEGGLRPGKSYWVLAQSGVVGTLVGESPAEKGHVGKVRYLGLVRNADGTPLNIRQFSIVSPRDTAGRLVPAFLVLGTSAEVGKTTAGVAILRALRKRNSSVVALKATGTPGVAELALYRDFGAIEAFDSIDFGLPTTYPSARNGVDAVFSRALDTCLSFPADAAVIECGGDILGANVPQFLDCLRRKHTEVKVILAAADALGALAAKRMLADKGLPLSLITGPCTDTPTLQRRTEELCGIPALNLARGDSVASLL